MSAGVIAASYVEASLDPFTLDLPAFNVNGVGGPDDSSDAWSTPDTGTEAVVGPFDSRGGVGYFAEAYVVGGGYPNLVYMPSTPGGYMLARATYVLIAYREGNDGAAGSYSGYDPTPTTVPFLYGESSATSDQYVFNDIPVGSYDGEMEWPGDEVLSRLTASPGSQAPANRLWIDTFVPGVGPSTTYIHVAYYAIRLYYEPI